MSVAAREAFARLQEGDRRFVSDERARRARQPHAREALAGRQHLLQLSSAARIHACRPSWSSTRVSQSVRHPVAGNIVAPSQVGSVEFAASRYGARLVVVLGHTQCGACRRRSSTSPARPSTRPTCSRSSSHPAVDRNCSRRRGSGRRGSPAPAGRARKRSRVRQPSSTWVVAPRAPDPGGGPDDCRRRVLLETGVVEFFDGPLIRGADNVAERLSAPRMRLR